jgi:hypothetical protein
MRFWLTVLFWWTVVSIVTGPVVGRFLRRVQPSSSGHGLIDGHRTRRNPASPTPITPPGTRSLPPSLTQTLGRPAVAFLLGRYGIPERSG